MGESAKQPPCLYTLLLLLLIGLAASAADVPKLSSSHRLRLPVGKVLHLRAAPSTATASDGDVAVTKLIVQASDSLWLQLNATDPKEPLVYGVSQWAQAGEHRFGLSRWLSDDGEEIDDGEEADDEEEFLLEVVEEEQADSVCGAEGSTVWLEVLDPRRLGSMSVEEQIRSVERLHSAIVAALKELDNDVGDFRLFPFAYLERYRKVHDYTTQLPEDAAQPLADQMVLTLNISCGELNEYAIDVISAVQELKLPFQVVQGVLNQARGKPQPETTTTAAESRRTTRQVFDNRPVAVNPLPTFQCRRGVLCRLELAENTFADAEDGTTSRLKLSVDALGKNHSNWLVPLRWSNKMEGVALQAGVHSFRLVARDKEEQAASLPFQVVVEESPADYNHQYTFVLDTTREKFTRPETLRDFIYNLTGALLPKSGRRPTQAELKGVQINDVHTPAGRTNELSVRWSNASLSRSVCQQAAVNATARQFISAGGDHKAVKWSFFRRMGASFMLKRASVELLASCLRPAPSFRVKAVTSTTQKSSVADYAAEPTGSLAEALMVPLILAAVLLLLVTLLVLVCCVHQRKRGAMTKKKHSGGGGGNGFVSKGMPVTFPGEVPQPEEEQGLLASSGGHTTPMLIAREKPPLDPASVRGTTLYENPLYRPPPVAQAQLVKQALPLQPAQPAPASNGHSKTSTFSPPPPLYGGQQPQRSGVVAPAVGQRLPPPYVAAI